MVGCFGIHDYEECDGRKTMSDTSFEWAQATEEHARLVMEWRNDPTVSQASLNQNPKTWPAFFEEYKNSYFSCARLRPLFFLLDGKRVGFLRFDPFVDEKQPHLRGCSVSIMMVKEVRGQGLGSRVLREIQPVARSLGYDVLYAEIRPENEGSIRAFEKAGFSFWKEESISRKDLSAPVRIQKYRLSLLPPFWQDRVFVIAEAGSNWRMGTPKRDWEMTRALIDVAVESGADAVKFQTFHPETIYVSNAGASDYLSEGGIEESMQDLFRDITMPHDLLVKAAEYSKRQGIQFLSSFFSEEDFDLVDPLVSIHKLASYEISHIRLIERAARSGKPLIMSTGAACEEEIQWAVDTFYQNQGSSLVLLQCTAQYPAKEKDANLRVIPWLRERFGVDVGLSDHTKQAHLAPVVSVALGARVIEKHFTLDRRLPGPDHYFAVTPSELKEMVLRIREAELLLGTGVKEVLKAEEELRYFARRGVQALCSISEGEILREGENLGILRPGKRSLGVHSRFLKEMEGRTAQRSIPLGEGLQKGDWK